MTSTAPPAVDVTDIVRVDGHHGTWWVESIRDGLAYIRSRSTGACATVPAATLRRVR